jgi:hypothetical protein
VSPPALAAGTVSAEFAGVLDGRALWLAVPLTELDMPAEQWSFAVRHEDGVLTPLGGDVDGAHLAVAADLPTVPGTYDVLVTAGDEVRPLVAPEPPPGPTRVPDHEPVRFALVYDDAGLRLTATPFQQSAEVVALATDGTSVTITVEGPGERLLFVQDKVDLGSVPMAPGPRGSTATVTRDDVPGTHVRLVVLDGERRRPVRRARNGLAAAGPAVLLPVLERDDGEPTLVCNWHAESGNLRLRLPDAKVETI